MMIGSSQNKKLKTGEVEVDVPTSTSTSPSMILEASSVPVEVRVDVDDGGKSKTESPSSSKPVISSEPGGAATVTNPFENAGILNHLFQCCSAKQLANCRLVCRQWYEESLLTWRTSFPITLEESGTKMRGVTRVPSPQKFLAYCADPKNQCSTKPYRVIKIANSTFCHKQDPSRPFKMVLGSNVTTLHLYKCSFTGVEKFPKFREIVFAACPNLQTLKVDQCTMTSRNTKKEKEQSKYREPLHGKHAHLKSLHVTKLWYDPLPISWLEFFSHFQALTYFAYKSEMNFCFEHGEFKRLSEAIKTVRKQDPNALPFKTLELDPILDISPCERVYQKNMGILQELGLTFKSLRINLEPWINGDQVKTVLEFQANTVTKIELYGAAKSVPGLSFPFGVHLDNLTVLDVYDTPLNSLVFLNYTPNLKKLDIRAEDDYAETKIVSNSCKQEMAHVRLLHLVKFRLEGVVADEDLATLFEWMPNITSLAGLTLNDKQFGIVCGNWKNLTKLVVPGYELTDVGVTGMANLGGEKKTEQRKKEATQPNIINLQNLEEFTFSSDKLTDESVFHLLQLPNLRRIWCITCGGIELGEEARKALEARNNVPHKFDFDL